MQEIARFILVNAQANLQLTWFDFNHMISNYRLVLLVDTMHNNIRLARYTIFCLLTLAPRNINTFLNL